MAVIVLVYHKTPKHDSDDFFDVPLDHLKSQLSLLADHRVSFIRFEDVNSPAYLSTGLHVCVTLDDGHASNAEAIGFMAERQIRPTAFIVRDWCKSGTGEAKLPGYLSSAEIEALATVCDIGAHGATHRPLTTLTDAELREELQGTRRYLEDVLARSVDVMALPGGVGNARVLKTCHETGFRLVGDSVPDLHRRAAKTVHRVTINRGHGVDYPLRLTRYTPSQWAARRAKRHAVRAAHVVLGSERIAHLKRGLNRAWAPLR